LGFLVHIAQAVGAPLAVFLFALGFLYKIAGVAPRPPGGAPHDEIQEMSELVNELLSFSKAGLNAGTVRMDRVTVADVVRRAAAREAFAGTAIALEADPGLAVAANDGLLLRALSNLLRNAVRYAGAGGPIEVTARLENGQVVLAVADRGPGLPPEELENVFAPFYRPEASRTRETGGAGLGLAIVRTCVEACGGTVRCRNREPHGLAVEIRLNAAEASVISPEMSR
jgi:two-component system sensor histidine kinase CpxA